MANRNTSKPYFQPLLQEIAKVLTLVPPGVIYLMDNEKRVAGILQPLLRSLHQCVSFCRKISNVDSSSSFGNC